ncbi:hypothetical protein BX265_6206 [Streptomyces sp. TLI_235]|nr:hypothetical protein [Streptomyces sp. TLI_235]PBC71596.1 hypothetical protein BX265_6206 [Streptomyces sp. TLI_235]
MRPSHLPKVRDQVLRHLTDPDMPIRQSAGPDNQPGLEAEISRLRAADLYWVAPDMAALAVSAGTQLAAARWATADRPSPAGLIVFDGGIGNFPLGPGAHAPIEALTWGPDSGELSIGVWLTRTTLDQRIRQSGRFAGLVTDQVAPLVPILARSIPAGPDPVPFADTDPDLPLLAVQTLAAAWLLMQQPTLTERRTEHPDKATARAYGRRQQAAPYVTLVDLRRAYVPDQRDETGTDSAGRHYRHRWVVQGHWRDQPHGPERALRRKQWIPAHVKGPDGAPLLATERVNVWRR